MVRTTLLSGRVLLGESLSCCLTISSNFGTVMTSIEVILRFAMSQPYAAKVGHERREI
jgi:hypothetical protein